MPDLAPAADALKCDLAAEVLRSSGQLRMRVSGTSMLPALWPGDILTIHRHHPGQLRPGDLVLAARNGGLAVHRLIAIHGPLVTTRGDALPRPDPPLPSDHLLGRVAWIQRGAACLTPRPGIPLPQRLLAMALRHSDGLQSLLLRLHALRRRRWAAV